MKKTTTLAPAFKVGDRVIVRATGQTGTVESVEVDDRGPLAGIALDNGGRCGIAANDVALERVPAKASTLSAAEIVAALHVAGIEATIEDSYDGMLCVHVDPVDDGGAPDFTVGPFDERGVGYANDVNVASSSDDGPVLRYVQSVEAVVSFVLPRVEKTLRRAPAGTREARMEEVLVKIERGDFSTVLDEDVHAEILAAIRNVLK